MVSEPTTWGTARSSQHGNRARSSSHWLVVSILALGALSLVILDLIHHIENRQRSHFVYANALMDLRIAAAEAHLWLEEGITGQRNTEVGLARDKLAEVGQLSQLILQGGESEYGWNLEPLPEPELHRRAAAIVNLVSKWTSIGHERLHDPETAGEGSTIENKSDALFHQLQDSTKNLERLVEERLAADFASATGLIAAILVFWSFVVLGASAWLLVWQRRQRLSEEALHNARDGLELEVSARTRQLRTLNHQLRLELTERRKAEQTVQASERQLRELSAKLLTTQEAERRRISNELHDQLGHSLVLVKLRLGLVRQGLANDQATLRADCDGLSDLIDHLVNDVRSLAMELRPSVLDELGLSRALGRLAQDIKTCDRYINIAGLPLEDIDRHLSHDTQVAVFRTLQETLTNVEKHAGAKHVSLRVAQDKGRVRFVVEDDGRGFDVAEAARKGLGERGLGLATMDERARMVNGSLTVSSEQGKGTRVTLSVPLLGGDGA